MTDTPHPISNVLAELGEGPLWDDHTGVLWFVDILGRHIHCFDPTTSATRSLTVSQEIGAVVPTRDGGLLAAVRDGIAIVDTETGALELVAPIETDLPENRMNDAKCDPHGRLWAGTMAFDAATSAGTLYRYDHTGAVTPILDGLTISNGLAWTADHRTMYFVDSAHGVDAFDFNLDAGTVANRRRHITIAADLGLPDGISIDTEDHLWIAIWGGSRVQRYRPDGTLDLEVGLPVSQVTSVTFGGATLQDLYITTARTGLSEHQLESEPLAGACFVCRPGHTGTPPAAFRN